MSWRTVIITMRCKLDLKMGYMVVRGEETRRIYLDEIAMLMIENPAVSLTGCLLEALIEKKVRVIFCDGKRSPMAELAPYYGSYDCSRKIRVQQEWNDDIRGAVWTDIISEKIKNQCIFLSELGKERETSLLKTYIGQVELYDATNREGHAAKVYFNALFGTDFTRTEDNVTNAALNYGYTIILSAFNREITSCGYLTQLGLCHCNLFNYYNLSCDLMEPFRILVDRKVFDGRYTVFSAAEKHALWGILNETVYIADSQQTVLNGIRIYTRSIFDALNEGDTSLIRFYRRI